MVTKKILGLLFLLLIPELYAHPFYFLEKKPNKSEKIHTFLQRYMLDNSPCNFLKFLSLNKINRIDKNKPLSHHRKYKLPLYVYAYNGKSIRSTINDNNYKKALRIKTYNEKMLKKKLRRTHYTKLNILWIPYNELYCKGKKNNKNKKHTVTLFGKKYQHIKIIDRTLKKKVYYVVSGHGGFDSGARYISGSNILCEDEYAYDVSLRLARKLMQHGATVYIITQDKNDGIRDNKYLVCDTDERSFYNKKLPRGHKKRLKQRTDDINSLYKKHKKLGVKSQLVISIHVDSRSYHKRQDVFFYHFPKSKIGKRTALAIQKSFEQKYQEFQKGRGYQGTVLSRNLYILENTYPAAILIELGNIRNIYDQKRIIFSNNRQALANWIYLGLKNKSQY